MEPPAPAPLTRAAAREARAAAGNEPPATASADGAGLMRPLALSAGAFIGAFIVLGIAALAGIPAVDPQVPAGSETEQIGVPTPGTTFTPSHTASPTPSGSATPTPTPTPTPTSDETAGSGVDPVPEQPAPEPAPTGTTTPTEPAQDQGPGRSGDAPGHNKPPTKP